MADTEQELGSGDDGAATDFPTVEPLDADSDPAKENFLPEGHDAPSEEADSDPAKENFLPEGHDAPSEE